MNTTPNVPSPLEVKRKSEILRAAKQLFCMRGFAGTTMDAIAAEAHISKALIYHYFESKDAVLLSFLEETQEYLDQLKCLNNPREALARFGEDFLVDDDRLYATKPPLQAMLITFADHTIETSDYPEANPILKDIGRTYLADLFQRGINDGLLKPGDAKVYGDLYWSYLLGKLLTVKKGNEHEPARVYVEEVLGLIDCRQEGELPERG